MSEKENGGPAFPIPFDPTGHQAGSEWNWTGGMSMRQWYAGQALIGVLSGRKDPLDEEQYEDIAEISFKLADLMIKVGKK